MDSPPPVPSGHTFKISRSGKIILELEGSAVFQALRTGQVLLTDHYWTAGMSDWATVGSRNDWDALSGAGRPGAAPAPAPLRRTLKGKVLDFNVASSVGLISGEDGIRYVFQAVEWRTHGSLPQPGVQVDFETDGQSACAVYTLSPASAGGAAGKLGYSDRSEYYRSSDDKFLAGICAGLAHKWDRPVWAVRLVCLLFFPFMLWFVYLLLWLAWKEYPTTGSSSRAR